MLRAVETLGGVIIIALLAGGLAEATLAFGGHNNTANDTILRPLATTSLKPKSTASPALSPAPVATVAKPSASPSPVPTVSPSVPTATTSSFVHLRVSNSTSSAIITDLNGGTVVELMPISDSQWQQVKFNGQTGYIFKAYLVY